MTGLQSWRDQGYRLTLYCPGYTGRPECSGWEASWDQLIQYFGRDAEIGRAKIFSVSECPVCGRRPDILTIHPPELRAGPWRAWEWQKRQDDPLSPRELREQQEREEHQKLMALYTAAAREKEKALYDKQVAAQKAQKRIDDARAKGVFLIGPPNPHQMKKGRPVMKG